MAIAMRSMDRPRRSASSVLFVLLLLTLPVTVFGEDEQSIATLRRMGKAFASIAEKVSPAVVGIRATKIERDDPREDSSVQPFSPFDEDLFDYFMRRRAPRGYQQQPQRQP